LADFSGGDVHQQGLVGSSTGQQPSPPYSFASSSTPITVRQNQQDSERALDMCDQRSHRTIYQQSRHQEQQHRQQILLSAAIMDGIQQQYDIVDSSRTVHDTSQVSQPPCSYPSSNLLSQKSLGGIISHQGSSNCTSSSVTPATVVTGISGSEAYEPYAHPEDLSIIPTLVTFKSECI